MTTWQPMLSRSGQPEVSEYHGTALGPKQILTPTRMLPDDWSGPAPQPDITSWRLYDLHTSMMKLSSPAR